MTEVRYTADDYMYSGFLPDTNKELSLTLAELCENVQVPMSVLNMAVKTPAHLVARIVMNRALADAQAGDDTPRLLNCWNDLPGFVKEDTGWYIRAYAAMGDLGALLVTSRLQQHDDYDLVDMSCFGRIVQLMHENRHSPAVLAGIMLGLVNVSKFNKFEDMDQEDDRRLVIALALAGYEESHKWINSLVTVDSEEGL